MDHQGKSIERKKKKGGIYEYFIVDKDGKIVSKLAKKYIEGRQLENGQWEFSYEGITPSNKVEITAPYDGSIHDSYTYTQEYGLEEKELRVIIDLDGEKVIDGIRRIIFYDGYQDNYLLELEPEFHQDWLLRALKFDLSFKVENGLFCIINSNKEFIIEPRGRFINYEEEIEKLRNKT